jgi:ABC-2 type transport system permease protein
MQAAFYITPILYLMTIVSNQTYQKVMLLNPMAQAIQDARYVAVSQDPRVITISRIFDGGWYMLIPFSLVLAALIIGLVYFRKESKYFAENI